MCAIVVSKLQQRTGKSPRLFRGAVLGVGRLAFRIYPVFLILTVWQAVSTFGVLSPLALPAPGKVWDRGLLLWHQGVLPRETLVTVRTVFVAYALALVVGVALGVLIARVTFARSAGRPLISFFFPMPKVVLYPAMLILLGFGAASKEAFGFSEALFPILLATIAAVSKVDTRLVWSAQALGASRRQIVLGVIVPASLPTILTGARIALPAAIVTVFVGEMIAGSDGLGQLMMRGWTSLDNPEAYVAILSVGVVALLLDQLFLLARGYFLAWSHEEDF
jgi:ABC-type nitrate/sulfonate/bicarbonate transport system permease component